MTTGADVCVNRFTINPLSITGLMLIERQRRSDQRGFLSRLFCTEELVHAGWQKPIAQINHTHTANRGMVRGLHYQSLPHAEMKLVSCIRGEVWDVAVDLRTGSPTFLHWHAERLSADNHRALLIPEGFAHGFQTLTDDVELIYCHSAPHTPAFEAGLNPCDARLAIAWPLPIEALSARDKAHPMVADNFAGIDI